MTAAPTSTYHVAASAHSWDPAGLNNQPASRSCTVRVKRDIMAIYNDPPPGIFVVPDEEDLTLIHALITGSFDTPYEGGNFYFIIKCPSDYPINPPRVKFMTTDAGHVRFNPNLYKSGKVCLSILGTWNGPSWSPAQSISSVLISIQSLLNEKPYHNEPGYEKERTPGDVERYNEVIRHETVRVAVLGMVENNTHLAIPKQLHDICEKTFLQFYENYTTLMKDKQHFHGQAFQDPFGENRGRFEYRTLLPKLERLYATLSEKWNHNASSGDSEESTPPEMEH